MTVHDRPVTAPRVKPVRPWDRLLASTAYRLGQRVDRYNAERLLRTCVERGPACELGRRATLTGGGSVHLGENVHIGDNAFIRGEGGLWVGDNTHVSRNLVLYTMDHHLDGDRLPYDRARVHRPVRIGRNVFIGMNVVVAPGSTIGDGAIIGMGTTISGTVPPRAIVVSVPWRQVGERDPEHYARLDEARQYSATDGIPYEP
jgi:acetyltransferase-like isoleucine patch superfamily enzyme